MPPSPSPQEPSPGTRVVGATVAVFFGIAWVALAFVIIREAPFGAVKKIFPLFGLIFVGFGCYQLRLALKDYRAEKRGEPLPSRQKDTTDSQRGNRFVGTLVAFCFLFFLTLMARSFPIPIIGKGMLLIGLVGLFFTGRSLVRQVKSWVKDQ